MAVPSVRQVLDSRVGEELELNQRHLNPQLGRIVRTIGFHRSWVGGEGAYLVDAAGDRYLDLLSGYGVSRSGATTPRSARRWRTRWRRAPRTCPSSG